MKQSELMPIHEIAAVTGLTTWSVLQILNSAIRKLRKHAEAEGFTAADLLDDWRHVSEKDYNT